MAALHEMVPRDPAKNVAWRRKVLDVTWNDSVAQADFWEMCRADLLFWVNTFCVLHEPRREALLPFATWPFQDETLAGLAATMENKQDACVFKSRDMGATYIVLMPILHRFLFYDNGQFLLLSRKEDLVDSNSRDSLFGKLDLQMENMPHWLLPTGFSVEDDRFRQKMQYMNPDRHTMIKGESTNDAAGVGGRYTVVVADEFARMDKANVIWSGLRDTAKVRWANFTAFPGATYAEELTKNENTKQFRLHWTKHPHKAAGLYVDPNGKRRSPWYDEECKRCQNQTEIDTDLDMLWVGSGSSVFDPDAIDRMERATIAPYERMRLSYERPPEGRWVDWARYPAVSVREDGEGQLMCWFFPDNLRANGTKIVCGVDVALGSIDMTGRGSSNSSAAFWGKVSGEKLGEITVSGMDPTRFAHLVVAASWWLQNLTGEWPKLKWEANGPGRQFGDEVMRVQYPNVFYRREERGMEHRLAAGIIPGWWKTKEEGRHYINRYAVAIRRGVAINRSLESVRELRSYVLGEDGYPYHKGAKGSLDPTGARENHGDRVTADFLAWSEVELAPLPEIADNHKRFNVAELRLAEYMRRRVAQKEPLKQHLSWRGNAVRHRQFG